MGQKIMPMPKAPEKVPTVEVMNGMEFIVYTEESDFYTVDHEYYRGIMSLDDALADVRRRAAEEGTNPDDVKLAVVVPLKVKKTVEVELDV